MSCELVALCTKLHARLAKSTPKINIATNLTAFDKYKTADHLVCLFVLLMTLFLSLPNFAVSCQNPKRDFLQPIQAKRLNRARPFDCLSKHTCSPR